MYTALDASRDSTVNELSLYPTKPLQYIGVAGRHIYTRKKDKIYAVREGKPKALRFKTILYVFVRSNMNTSHEEWIVRMATVGRKNCRRKSKE